MPEKCRFIQLKVDKIIKVQRHGYWPISLGWGLFFTLIKISFGRPDLQDGTTNQIINKKSPTSKAAEE